MSKLVSILRAVHCRSTHHYFAIDALAKLDTARSERLAGLLLKYHDEYLVGAKAPDSSFRDFQNHVLHVGDNHWGGAPKACERWAADALTYLDQRKWKKAAYACGVLSHYFTDPLMPLHTGSSDAETAVHRPLEWSVCKSYDAIYELIEAENLHTSFVLSSDDDWARKAVTQGAELAHPHYKRLIALYDLERGCKNPPDGLNDESRSILARMFGVAISGWSQILSKLAEETTSEIPEFPMQLTTFLATIDMPLAWIVQKISNTNERLAVKRILKEFEKTGSVVRNAPKEIKVVRQKLQERGNIDVLDSADVSRTASQPHRPSANVSTKPSANVPTKTVDAVHTEESMPTTEPSSKPIVPSETVSASPPSETRPSQPQPSAPGPRGNREGVSVASNLVDAPSIGPKTARRFKKIGVTTIGQFLEADVEHLRERLNTRWITTDLLLDWQAQATLVCEVPKLCGYKAQLLVAAECRTTQQLAESDAGDLVSRIADVCETSEGQRIIRSSDPPHSDDIAEWIEAAKRSGSGEPNSARAA